MADLNLSKFNLRLNLRQFCLEGYDQAVKEEW